MVRVYLDFDEKRKKWKEVDHSNFYIDKYLLKKLKNLKMIQKKKWDGVMIIDGKERSGKSILGMLCGWYLSDCTLGIKNFARGLSDAAKKIAELPEGSVLIMDEGSTVFSSKDSTTSAQKKLVKLMDVVGQRNLIFIICLPCIFDLNKTIAVRRSLFLCHVYPDQNYNRGRYAYWGEKSKKALYKYGKLHFDSYAFPNAEFIGEYLDFEPPFLQQYLKKIKRESLDEVLADALDEKKSPAAIIRKEEIIFYGYLKVNKGFTLRQLQLIKKQALATIKDRVDTYIELYAPNSLEK